MSPVQSVTYVAGLYPRWSGLRPAALVGYLARVRSGPKPLSFERWTANALR